MNFKATLSSKKKLRRKKVDDGDSLENLALIKIRTFKSNQISPSALDNRISNKIRNVEVGHDVSTSDADGRNDENYKIDKLARLDLEICTYFNLMNKDIASNSVPDTNLPSNSLFPFLGLARFFFESGRFGNR